MKDDKQILQATRLIRAQKLDHNQLETLNLLLPPLLVLIKAGFTDRLEFKVVCEGLAKPKTKNVPPMGGWNG